jgi:PHD/YefM family antitoxin component YafN of YafNO toxin-antitoxin module
MAAGKYMPTYAGMYSSSVADEFVTVAQLRAEMASVLARLGKARHIYVLQRGQPRAVLVDLREYRALIDQLEYLDDSLEAIMAHQRLERGEETTRPFDEVVREIRARHAASRKAKPLKRRARVSR